jgi:4-aminobutyrate aminotransferase-like enzyme
MGLMLAIEMDGETREIADRCLARGLVVNSTAGNVLRFLPPLTVSEGEIQQCLLILEESLPQGGRK